MRRVLPLLLLAGACYEAPTVPPTPSDLAIVSGSGQSGIPGYRLANQVTVKLMGSDGRPSIGDTVRFELSDETAIAEPAFAITDSSGLASTWWRLGGQLGTQTLSARVNAVPAVSVATIGAMASSNYMVSIDGGPDGLCGVDTQGRLGCWMPPRRTSANPATRFAVANSSVKFKAVTIPVNTTGGVTGCALAESGRPWCFSLDGQANVVGLTELQGSYPPLTEIVSGNEIASYCGLTSTGEAWCWGVNGAGQLGDGTLVAHTTPQPVATAARFVQIDIDKHACAITATGEAWCWGENGELQSGGPPDFPVTIPRAVTTSLRFTKVRVDDRNGVSCGFVIGGGLSCWGHTEMMGTTRGAALPTQTPISIATPSNAIEMMSISGVHFLFDAQSRFQYSGDFFLGLEGTEGFALSLRTSSLINILSDVKIIQGWQYLCGTAVLGGATLCPSTEGLISRQPDGTSFFTLPPVVGVPFP